MSEHTPGPWRYEQISTCGAVYQGSDYRMEVCRVNGRKGEQQANARLIAAAPQLLEACMALMVKARHSSACASVCGVDGSSGGRCDCGIDEAYEKARAALRAATEPTP